MALRDYIRCKECDCKLVPDGDEVGREHIDSIWGCTEKEHYWKSVLLCPDCINKLEQRLAAAEEKLFATEELAKEYSMLSEVAKDRDWYDGLRIVKPWQVKETRGSEEE